MINLGIEPLAARINSYSGGPVTRDQVEDVLDFNILLEPDEDDLHGGELYQKRAAEWSETISKGDAIVRQFGTQLPSDLGLMQAIFYSFTNSSKYRYSPMSISVARTVLDSNWDGVNGWRS